MQKAIHTLINGLQPHINKNIGTFYVHEVFERFIVTVSVINCLNFKVRLCFVRNWVLLYINENENRST